MASFWPSAKRFLLPTQAVLKAICEKYPTMFNAVSSNPRGDDADRIWECRTFLTQMWLSRRRNEKPPVRAFRQKEDCVVERGLPLLSRTGSLPEDNTKLLHTTPWASAQALRHPSINHAYYCLSTTICSLSSERLRLFTEHFKPEGVLGGGCVSGTLHPVC